MYYNSHFSILYWFTPSPSLYVRFQLGLWKNTIKKKREEEIEKSVIGPLGIWVYGQLQSRSEELYTLDQEEPNRVLLTELKS